MVNNYSYDHLSYRINIKNNDFSIYDPFFKGLKLPDYIDRPDAERILDNERGLYHELIHLYQDIFLPACICERDLKNKILASLTFSTDNKNEKSEAIVKHLSLFNYLFRSDYCEKNLYSISQNEEGLDFWAISYTDLLESYADIRTTKTILDSYFRKNDSTDAFLMGYIRKKSLFHYDIIDERKLLVRLRDSDRPYAICKHVFLTLFSEIHSPFYCNDEMNTFNIVKSDLARAFTYEKDKRFYQLERNLDIFILFCIEFALTLPSISYIIKSIEDGKDKRMFHPGCRFYSLIAFICKYPDTFNNLDFDANYTEVFDQISEMWGSYKYQDVIDSLTQPYLPFYSVQFCHNRILIETPRVSIGNRCNIDIMNFFKQTGTPILLWGDQSQQIYVGNGVDKFELYEFRQRMIKLICDYIGSYPQRMNLGTIRNLDELKLTTIKLFLQESAASYVLNRCANIFINNKKGSVCPIDCISKDENCIIFQKINSKDDYFCVIPDLIRTL